MNCVFFSAKAFISQRFFAFSFSSCLNLAMKSSVRVTPPDWTKGSWFLGTNGDLLFFIKLHIIFGGQKEDAGLGVGAGAPVAFANTLWQCRLHVAGVACGVPLASVVW